MRQLAYGFFLILLAGCASWLATGEPSKVEAMEQRYIETETALKNSYGALEQFSMVKDREDKDFVPILAEALLRSSLESAIIIRTMDSQQETTLSPEGLATLQADTDASAVAARTAWAGIPDDDFSKLIVRMDAAKRVLRDSLALTEGSCLDMSAAKELDLAGCLNREQIALVLLNVLSQYNKKQQ